MCATPVYASLSLYVYLQIMVSTKPLSEPILVKCQLNHGDHVWAKLELRYRTFPTRKLNGKCLGKSQCVNVCFCPLLWYPRCDVWTAGILLLGRPVQWRKYLSRLSICVYHQFSLRYDQRKRKKMIDVVTMVCIGWNVYTLCYLRFSNHDIVSHRLFLQIVICVHPHQHLMVSSMWISSENGYICNGWLLSMILKAFRYKYMYVHLQVSDLIHVHDFMLKLDVKSNPYSPES